MGFVPRTVSDPREMLSGINQHKTRERISGIFQIGPFFSPEFMRPLDSFLL